MLEIVPKKRAVRSAFKRRRQEIEDNLAAYGLHRGSGGFASRTGGADHEETYGWRLRKALESLGPVFSSFGLYLASRADLLPVQACLELAAIPDWAEATPITAVQDVIARELSRPQTEIYPIFDNEPFESRLLFQSHRAVLNNGNVVTVKVAHPALQEQWACDLELLPVLQGILRSAELSDLPIEDAIADFRYMWQRHINLIHEGQALAELARDAQAFDMLRVPMVYKEFCSSQVITLEHIPGVHLGKMLASSEQSGLGTATADSVGLDEIELAHRLCLVWLRQALLGNLFPTEARLEDIIVLPSKQIAFTGGIFASLPSEAKQNVWHYLIASSNEEPDKACTYLLREMRAAGQPVNEDELRYRFREVVPFRDSGWVSHTTSTSIAEYLFVHWRITREHGLRPPPHVIGFYRGLFQIAAHARRFAPHSDPLLKGLQDVRTIEMLNHFQEMMGLQYMSESLDKYVTLMMKLPKQLDAVLTLAAVSNSWLPPWETGAVGQRGQKHSLAVMIALLLVLAVIVLLTHHLKASAIASVWVDQISAMLFVLVGALLLRTVSRY